jgi:hypothetical protein
MKKLIVALFVSLISIAASAQNSKVIVQLTNPLKDSFWFPLTDQIRFGEKGSTAFMSVDWEKATGSFFGELKINDGAGFASYRNIDKVDLSDYNTLEIPVKGDGRKYKVILKDQQAMQSLIDYTYQAEFTTSKNELKQVGLNLEDFKPVYRGQVDNSLPELNKAQIEEMGLQINDKIQGPYSLEFGEWTATK